MRLRRASGPAVDPQFAPLMAELWLAFEDALALSRQIADARTEHGIAAPLRAQALEMACRIAYASRVAFEALINLDLVDRVPAAHNPVRALAASARLAYSLTAASEEDPEPETILTLGELDGLVTQYSLGEWLTAVGERAGGAS